MKIPCHKYNQKSVHADYIYLISYRNAKKANLKKRFPYLKTISQQLQGLKNLLFVGDI